MNPVFVALLHLFFTPQKYYKAISPDFPIFGFCFPKVKLQSFSCRCVKCAGRVLDGAHSQVQSEWELRFGSCLLLRAERWTESPRFGCQRSADLKMVLVVSAADQLNVQKCVSAGRLNV